MGEGPASAPSTSVTAPSVLLGIGFGGFIDGIVLHQVLQWHHMLSSTRDYPASTVAGLEINTLWDGIFHLLAYIFVAVGLFVLWSRARQGGIVWTWRSILGWGFVGWGFFNLVEGIIDHHLIGIHHVKPGASQLSWDLGFLALGVVLVVLGGLLVRSDGSGNGRHIPAGSVVSITIGSEHGTRRVAGGTKPDED